MENKVREVLTFSEEEGANIAYDDHDDFSKVSDHIYDTGRWEAYHELVVKRKSDGKLFSSAYSVGLTESQDKGPYEYDGNAEFFEVVPVEKIIIDYIWPKDITSADFTTTALSKKIEELEKVKSIRKNLAPWFKAFVSCKDIDLELRWQVFVDNDLGDHGDWYQEPPGIDWNKRTLLDDFYYERYTLVNVEAMYERALDFFETEEDDIKFREYFLENYIKSFIHDW